MVGAAIATAITFLTYNLLKVVYVKYRFNMQPFFIETFKGLMVIILATVIGGYITILPQMPFISIVIKSVFKVISAFL